MNHTAFALALTLVATAPAHADGEVSDVPGETIVITGLRLPRAVRDTPAAVTVIDQRELARSPLVLTDELLRMLPSVGTFRRSSSLVADPTSQGLNLRGVGPSAVSRALVLRDGIPANDPFGGWMYWRSISPLGIDRIEAAPSGASALFGDFALGGVVQILSRPITPRTLEAVIAGGSLETGRAAARATHRSADFGVAADAEAFRSGGYAPIAAEQRGPIDGRASSWHGSSGLRLEHVRAGWTTHATGRWFQESLEAGTQFTTADVRTVTYGAGTKLVRDGRELQLEVFGGDQLFRQTRARVTPNRETATLASRQRTPSNNQGALAMWTEPVGKRHVIVVGVDGRRVSGTATDSLSPPMIEDDTLIERKAGGEQRFLGVFLQDAIRVSSRVELAAALRLDAWQNRDASSTRTFGNGDRMTTELGETSELELDPRLGVIVHATDVVSVRGSVYRAFRAPTLNELYRPFQVGTVLTAANDALRPETLWGAEAGPQIVLPTVVVRATAFWNQLDDAIANVTLETPLPSGATRQRQNLGGARVAGLELDASWRPAPAWIATIAHTFMDGKVTTAPAAPTLVGKRLPQDPRFRTTASLTFDDARFATISAQMRHLGRQFEDDQQTQSIGSVILFDARIGRTLGRGVSIFVSGQNLFDRRYLVGRAGIDTEGAPRTFEIGLAYR
ncbi:MAG: TonB-dependent receptor [Deltaproteobacteria bacterium]|nr:TonB-dependent receptor [Deltaproteobacteria bacterium]